MKYIICWIVGHHWGDPKDIRPADFSKCWAIFAPIFLFALLLGAKDCDRTCQRCGQTKTMTYERK